MRVRLRQTIVLALFIGWVLPAYAQPARRTEPSDSSTATAQEPADSFWDTITFGATLEGYYQYNWNRPPDRTVALRAYDTRSNSFSL